MKCTQRLYLTADKSKLVADGHPKAKTLYAVPGDEIPQSAVEKFGLVDGHLKGFDPAAEAGSKEDQGGQDKERKDGGNKGAPPPPPPPPPASGDDLAKLKGVGAKTAGALGTAGFASFAAIAAIDPASPPTIEGLPAVFKWADVVASAKELAAAAGAVA